MFIGVERAVREVPISTDSTSMCAKEFLKGNNNKFSNIFQSSPNFPNSPAWRVVSLENKLRTHPQAAMRSSVRDNLHLRQPTIIAFTRSQTFHLARVQIQIAVDDAIFDQPIVVGQWR